MEEIPVNGRNCQHMPVDTLNSYGYGVGVHPIQRKLLELAQKRGLEGLGLREVGRLVGEPHPQKIKYHLQKLNLLDKIRDSGRISDTQTRSTVDKKLLVSIPLYGLANCGPATVLAGSVEQSVLQISPRLVKRDTNLSSLFAVKAVGNSMNRASIAGKTIQDGDYVIVDGEDKDFSSGDYVLSIINGLANIKRLLLNDLEHQVVLVSESSEDYPPIFVHARDFENYFAAGKVIAVLKAREEITEVVYDKDAYAQQA